MQDGIRDGCVGKVKLSRNHAESMKRSLGHKINKSMRVYECPVCHNYHLTKKKRDSY